MQIPEASTEYAVETVGTGSSNLNITYPATIKGKQDIEIRAQVSGTITKLLVEEGQTVNAGQTLFIIDQVPYEAALKAAQAAVKVATAAVKTQKLTVANQIELNKKQIISNYQLETSQNTLTSYEAQLAQAQANLASAQHNLSYTIVKSPSAGVVGEIPFRVGALVGPSSAEALTTVSNIGEMYVYFSMTEKQMLEMARTGGNIKGAIANMPMVKLQLSDGSIYTHTGKIETASGVIDQTTGSVQMRATFPNPSHELRSGGSANILLPKTNASAITIPQSATFEIQDKIFVYVVGKDNKVKTQAIEVESQNDGQNYIITSGLTAGTRIVVEGISTLKNDMQIKPITPALSIKNRRAAEKERSEWK